MLCADFTPASAKPLPNAEKHAQELIRDFGIDVALGLARDYCRLYPGSMYWNAVREHAQQAYRARLAGGRHP